jgi:hypothetical protein
MWSRNPNFELYNIWTLPAVNPAGDRFATTSVNDNDRCSHFITDDGQPDHPIYTTKSYKTDLMLAPQWSPDAASKSFSASAARHRCCPITAAPRSHPSTIHPDGTGLKQLSNTRGKDAHLAWSPDGSRILFTSSRMGFKDEALITGNPRPYGEIL